MFVCGALWRTVLLVCHWMKHVSLNVFRHSFLPFLSLNPSLPARPRNKQNHWEYKQSHFPNVDGLSSFQPSATAPLHPLTLTLGWASSICQPPHHYPVMTLPFQFIPALSLPLPWPIFWNSRKQATSPPLLPSRSVSLRQHAVTPPAHAQPFCASHWMPAAQPDNLTGRFLPPKCSCLLPSRQSGFPGDVEVIGEGGSAHYPGERSGPR